MHFIKVRKDIMISEKTDFFLGAGQLNKIILYYGALQKNIAGAHN